MRPAVPIFAVLVLAPAGRAAESVEYLRDVKPLLAARCYPCHGALKQKAGLRVDTVKSLLRGGDNGPALVAGKSGESLLIEHVTARDGARRMPPESEGEGLRAAEVRRLRDWIDRGAAGPADEKPEADPKEHWAFRAPVRPPVPAVADARWRGNPVDAFLAAAWERHGLTPQPPADRRLLLRRVTLDLTGLPPTWEEQQAFLADPAPDAYERVVDRLLASPRYGERWGQHWMDVWRYSDWWGLGAEVRNSQKHIYHWRDWIIESVNADKGYDQMIREMLAADELYPTDPDKLRATGFLARQYFKFNRTTWLDETVEHTGKAFLGLTVNCAKCHDHKYDPIAQVDYYRLRAFFEPYQVRTDQAPGEVDFEKDGIPRAFDCNLDSPTYLFERGDEKRPVKDRPLTPGVPPLLALGELRITPVTLPPEAVRPGLRPFVLADHLRAAEQRIAAAQTALQSAPTAKDEPSRAARVLAEKTLAAAEAQPPALRARAAADRARAQQPPAADAPELARRAVLAERQAAVARADEELARAELDLFKADATKKAEATKKRDAARAALTAARKAAASPGEDYTPLRGALKTPESNLDTGASLNKPFPATSTGRRTALAQWLTDPRHPLTARVAVNHVWARHFGRPLVATVFDFGRKGAAPTHPELLDFLAVEFMEHGWSMKHLHRLIVTSQAYRLSSSAAGAASVDTTADPENRYLWRMNPVRMEAEAVRDGLLHLAGELDLTTGGPPIDPKDEQSRRRSVYFFHSHNDQHKFLALFDGANVLECYRRSESIVPQQALALANSRFALGMAEKISNRLHQRLGEAPDERFIRAAFETILAGTPTDAELTECQKALTELVALTKDRKRARADLVHALLNHNDFITIR